MVSKSSKIYKLTMSMLLHKYQFFLLTFFLKCLYCKIKSILKLQEINLVCMQFANFGKAIYVESNLEYNA
jgi:hypothetical protein